MDCNETRQWLDAYMDDELDLARAMETEEHLEACTACTEARQQRQTLRDSIKNASLTLRCPDHLRASIESMLCHDVGKNNARRIDPGWWLAVAASIVLIAGAAWLAQRSMFGSSASGLIAQEVVDSHVRSLLADHLTDVASSDRHMVKPWFAGKLDFAPNVPELASDGYPLAGGRLDYIDHQPVAAIVYLRRQHAINLFLWPSENAADTHPQLLHRQGYQIVHWRERNITYWSISDLNGKELLEFVDLVRAARRGETQEAD